MSVLVPHPRPFSVRDDDVERVIVVRTVGVLELNRSHDIRHDGSSDRVNNSRPWSTTADGSAVNARPERGRYGGFDAGSGGAMFPRLSTCVSDRSGTRRRSSSARADPDLHKRQIGTIYEWSGWPDSNRRPLDPQKHALRATCDNSNNRGQARTLLPRLLLLSPVFGDHRSQRGPSGPQDD
jgi:hypothetical protein